MRADKNIDVFYSRTMNYDGLKSGVIRSFLAAGLSLLVYPNTSLSSDFGTTGFVKMPSARMTGDGSLVSTISRDVAADIFNITFQATPWLETTFRYSIFNPRNLASSKDSERDRSYEAKLMLTQEGQVVPQISVGVRDILGTGLWEGEYVVASKKIDAIDFGLGIGWGRYSSRMAFANPLATLDSAFELRPSGRKSGGRFGGESRSKSYFRGDVGVFGGASINFPGLRSKLVIEFSSDDYSREVALDTIERGNAWNLGWDWQLSKQIELGATYLRGESWGLRLRANLDAKKSAPKKSSSSFISSYDMEGSGAAPEQLDMDLWYDRLLFDVERSGLMLNQAKTHQGSEVVSMEIENHGYQMYADAIQKTLTLSNLHLPRETREIRLLLRENGFIGPTVVYQSGSDYLMTEAKDEAVSRRVNKQSSISFAQPERMTRADHKTDYLYPRIALGADFAGRAQLMDPDAPFRKQLLMKFSSRLLLSKNTDLWFSFGQDVYNDFSNERVSNSIIQRVRSDVNRYLTEGESGIDQLFLESRMSLSSQLHLRAYVGILEMMYGGIGGEILFDPRSSRLAVSATVNAVRQRDFRKNLDFREYETVTAYLSTFYASPLYDLDFGLHIGRYLGRDKGGTLEVRRSFKNGFSIGGFFTRTDLSAEEFGEGSFDKGLFFSIPLNSLVKSNTRSKYSTILRPLDRDGGRRMEDFSGSLWFSMRSFGHDHLIAGASRMLPE